MGALGDMSKSIRKMKVGGNPEDEAPAEAPVPAPAEAPAAGFNIQKVLQDRNEARRALDMRRQQLIDSMDSRRGQMFNPQLLAIASGMLAPTKTGSFGESLGYAARGLGEEQQKQAAEEQNLAKMRYEMELAGYKQKQEDLGFNLMNDIMSGRKPQTNATAGAAPGMPAGNEPASATNKLASLSDDELFALSGVPELKPQVETILKLREQSRKENIKFKYGDQEREVPLAEYNRYLKANEEGNWPEVKKWHQKFGLPFNYVEDPKAPGGLRQMNASELASATEREKGKFGEQKEYTISYGGGTRKFPLTPAQYVDYLDASTKGDGDTYINKLFNLQGAGRSTPAAGGASASGAPRTKAEEEIETAADRERATKRVGESEKNRESLFESARAARTLIQNSDQIIQLANDPKTSNIFGVFAKPGILNALGTLVSEGAKVGNWSISVPSVENAMRKAGATDEEIKAAAVAARIFAQNELGFRRMFLSGQGSVSNMEGMIIPRFSGDLSDSPKAAQAKAELTKARAELDSISARALREWERKPGNEKKNFVDFEDSPEYSRLLDQYDAKLKKIMQVHFPGERINSAPNRPVGAPSARPTGSATTPTATQAPRGSNNPLLQ